MNLKITYFFLFYFLTLESFASQNIGTGIIFSNNHDYYATFTFESLSGGFALPGRRHVRVYDSKTGDQLWSTEGLVGFVDNFYLSDNGEYLIHVISYFRRNVLEVNLTHEELLELSKKTVIQFFHKDNLINEYSLSDLKVKTDHTKYDSVRFYVLSNIFQEPILHRQQFLHYRFTRNPSFFGDYLSVVFAGGERIFFNITNGDMSKEIPESYTKKLLQFQQSNAPME